jgi:hypothetical protein
VSFIFGGGGGGTTNQQPQAGSNFQIYQPQNQPGFDQSYQNLVNSLYGQAQAGLPQQTPASAVYPGVQQIAGTASYLDPSTGAYGFGGPQALTQAEQASYGYQSLLPQLQSINQTLLNANIGAIPGVQSSAFSPYYGSAVSNTVNNPYFNQAMSGAQTGADQGLQAAQSAFGAGQNLNQLASTLPGQAQSAAAQTQQQIPLLQQLASLEGGIAPGMLSQAQALSPQLQQLYNSIVPQLSAAGPQYAQQAGATNPALQAIGASGQGLSGAAQGLANQAINTSPNALANINQTGQGLMAQAPGLAAAAQNISPNMLQQINQAGKGLISSAPGYANQELGLNAPLSSAESSILNTGFDPQSALYNRTAGQLLDQARAAEAQSGVGTTPYGAGVTGNTMSNFNIDWQNQQLARQTQAAQAAQGLSGQQASNITGAGGLLSGLTGAGANLGLGVAGQRLAQDQAANNILNQTTGLGANLGLGVAGQRLANTQAGANILGNLTTAGGNLGLGAASGQLANTQTGGGLLNSLLQGAAGTGGQLTNDQINALLGGGQAFNQLAQGAGSLASGAANLSGAGLNQILAGYGGAGNLAGQGAQLGAGASALSSQAAAQPANTFNQQQQAVLQALGQQTGAAATGAGALGNLTNQSLGVGNQFTQNLQNQAAFGQLPQQTAQQQQQNALNALTQQVNLGNQNYTLPQQVLNDLQSYLQLGQSASQYGGQLAALAGQQQQGNLSSIGTLGSLAGQGLFGSSGLGLNSNPGLLGTGTPGLFASGGLSGLASGQSGLLSNLFGGGGLLSWGEGVPFIP